MKYELLSNICSEESNKMGRLKIRQNDDKRLSKVIGSNYHMEQNTLIEGICANNINTWENVFSNCYFWSLWVVSFFENSEKNSILRSVWIYFALLEQGRPS